MGSFYKKNKHIKNRFTNRITFNFPLSTFNSICRSTERQIGNCGCWNFGLTKGLWGDIIRIETVEAGVKAVVHLQRARGAGSRAGRRSLNGPLRVGGNVFFGKAEYFPTCGHTSVAQGLFGLGKVRCCVGNEARWHRGSLVFVLDRSNGSVRDAVFLYRAVITGAMPST